MIGSVRSLVTASGFVGKKSVSRRSASPSASSVSPHPASPSARCQPVPVTTCTLLSCLPLTACQAAAQPPHPLGHGEGWPAMWKDGVAGGGRTERKGVKRWSETRLSFCHLFRMRDVESMLGDSAFRISTCAHTRTFTLSHRKKSSSRSWSARLSLLDLFRIKHTQERENL